MEMNAPGETPPSTPPSSPPPRVDLSAVPRYSEMDDAPRGPLSPLSPTSASVSVSVSASAVSATEQPRFQFPEMSASVDATPMPRYLGRYDGGGGAAADGDDDVEAELRRMAQRQLPRGDLGRLEWRLDSSGASGVPRSPTGSVASHVSGGGGGGDGFVDGSAASLPRPPASPPSSPRSASRSRSVSGSVAGPSAAAATQEQSADLAGAVVWGTNISVAESMALFRSFLREFHVRRDGDGDGDGDAHGGMRHPALLSSREPFYESVLRHLALTQSPVFNLDTQHLLQHRPARKLYNQLVLFPQVLIRILDMVVNDEFRRVVGGNGNGDGDDDALQLQVRPFNLSDLSPMRQLNPSDIDQLVGIKGMVTRVSAIIPDLKEAFFRCALCHATAQVELDRGRIEEPTFCAHCQARHCMEMLHNRCVFTDKQLVKMQETPDAIPEGETPYTVMLFAFDDLVDDVRPGDKIEVTGIYRAVPLRTSSRQRVVKSVFKTYLDVVHFRRVDELVRRRVDGAAPVESDGVGDGDGEDVGGSDVHRLAASEAAQAELFRRIAAHPNVYQNLAHSLAPSIWELDDVKKGILCMLFGGTRKRKGRYRHTTLGGDTAAHETSADGGRALLTTTRADMNVLLCGDPGTSKSQLLSYVHKLSPRSIYTSGKGSSAVGLTASIVRDMETGDLVLESGALVLSDEGICCIDEFDKMSDSARSVLHEVMEQQTVSIAKAGIICSLNARASILASANPIESRYNPNKSVIENVNILPTLLSRFDLIYLILDKPQPETDRQLARHIVALYFDDATRQQQQQQQQHARLEPISMRTLTEYIAFAKRHVHPKLTPAARDALVRAYLELRRMGHGGSASSSRKNITATPRQLESLIRIAEALAKMKLSDEVLARDVHEALRLMNVATQRAAMDPRTGTIDMDMINTGHSSSEREAVAQLVERIKAALQEAPGHALGVGELRKALEDKLQAELKTTEFQTALRALEDEDALQLAHGVVRYFGGD
ncbi:hypothetical protein ATCC90586_003445 [Pythium insidiosum]|nr:hypothetical protein ATCC90586_003445 [Pythium insidiosum]